MIIIKNMNEFRVIDKMNSINDGTRTLFESIIMPEVILALDDLKNGSNNDYVLIGGLALSYYIRPRTTTDIDILFLSNDDIPNEIPKFKKHRKLAFQHNMTHVEIETITPKSINVPFNVVQMVFDTAIITDGIKIASPSAIIALKLFRYNRMDQADIENLIKSTTIDLTPFNLPLELLEKYNEIKNSIN